MSRITADLLLLACAAIWGLSFLFQKSAMAHVEPMTFVAARSIVAAMVLAPLAWFECRRATNEVPWKRLVALSALTGVAYTAGGVMQQAGIVTTSVTNAGFLTALYVVATPFVSYAITRHALTPAVWVSAALSFVGTWLLSGGSLSLSALSDFRQGDMLVAGSALFWALHVVLIGLGAPLLRPITFMAIQFSIAGVLCLIGALLGETISIAALSAAAFDIVYVGVLAGALTFTVFTIALRATSPTEAVVVLSSEMLFAALAAWWVRGEQLTSAGFAGAAAILAAILIVQLSRSRRVQV